MAGNIFINYRRGDDPGFTQALYGRLEQVFPPERLFMDVDNIAPGLDFVQVLNEQVASCDVLIAVVGPNWLAAIDESGQRRLDNPEDFVRVEIESALSQKKRVIPVLVNDAKMPRSTELPEGLKPFARCNAVRLTHDRFRADTTGLIKSLGQVLAGAEAARQAEEDERLQIAEAEAKAETERRKQESQSARTRRIRRQAEEEATAEAERQRSARAERDRTQPQAKPNRLVGWIAGLPSEISWGVPVVVAAILVVGWVLPRRMFLLQGSWSLWLPLYIVVCLLAVGAVLFLRRRTLGGAELALYWFAAISVLGCAAVLVVGALDLVGTINADLPMSAIALLSAGFLIAIRRTRIGGLEFAVYWFGLVLLLRWGIVPFVVEPAAASPIGTYFSDNAGYRAAGIVLAGVVILSALVMLLARGVLRWSRLSWPEIAIYVIGITYMLYIAVPLVQPPPPRNYPGSSIGGLENPIDKAAPAS